MYHNANLETERDPTLSMDEHIYEEAGPDLRVNKPKSNYILSEE